MTEDPIENFASDPIADDPSQSDSAEQPQVYAVGQDFGDLTFTRRDFLAAAGALAGAAALTGCGSASTPSPTSTQTPTSTPRPTSTQTPTSTATSTPTPTTTSTPTQNSTLSPDDKAQACTDLLAHAAQVKALAFSQDGKMLATVDWDSTLKLWSLPEGALMKTVENFTAFDALAISPDGKLLAGALHSGITLLSLADETYLYPQGDKIDFIKALAFSPDGTSLVAAGIDMASGDSIVELWSLPEGDLLQTLPGKISGSESTMALSPDGKLLASPGEKGEVEIRSLPGFKLLRKLVGHSDWVISLAISSDGKTLASGSRDGTTKIWSLPEGDLLQTLSLASESMAISPDGKYLAYGSPKGTIRLRSLPDGEFVGCLIDLAANTGNVQAATYQQTNTLGQVVTFSLPCGSPIPAGAVCTCNCVASSQPSGASHYWYPN
jgi:WD40 repeat protein